MRKSLLALLIAALLLTGCQLDPMKVRDQVALAYGFIGDLQMKYETQCRATPQQAPCVLINRGVAVERLAATSLNEWCAGPPLSGQFTYAQGGPCSTQPGVEPRLRAALADLNSVMNDLKKLGGN